MMGGGFIGGFPGGGMILMALFGLIFMGVVITGLWMGLKYFTLSSGRSLGVKRTEPLTQLKMRLARGELTPDEYEMLRAHLRD